MANQSALSNPINESGGVMPFRASYGKLMMWYFLISDTFTFVAFLVSYAAIRMTNLEKWPNPSQVFKSIPIHGLDNWNLPLVFVSIMTFILILSSVTMVRAVQEGAMMNRKGVVKYLIPTIFGGILFLVCQYLEWTHLIHEGMTMTNNPFPGSNGDFAHQFGALFFSITGFHGLHVFGGVILNTYLLLQTLKGHYDRLGHYEMVEKIGLYWHFVDLVWVYVFLAFYLM
ncbi:MAG: cytochrome c oxidase subunit 3 [Chitinophagales bacterium]|jgi:cytochrome c oxidase subunit 3|nr:cytochrome c oxidase subunit 3 [Chitinophagales bacterium]